MAVTTVNQLIVGFAKEENGVYRATGSVTLIKSMDRVILFDCGDPWNGAEIVAKLRDAGHTADEVTDVVVSHGHLDHCANIGLFPRATVYMGTDYATNGEYHTLKEPHSLSEDVSIHQVKGHTDCDLILIVNGTNRGCIVVAGDIFESANDEDAWRALSRFPAEHEQFRKRISTIATWIVPGHGPMFRTYRNR